MASKEEGQYEMTSNEEGHWEMTSNKEGQEEMASDEDSTSDSLKQKHGYSLMQWITKRKTKSLWKVLNHVSSALYGIL